MQTEACRRGRADVIVQMETCILVARFFHADGGGGGGGGTAEEIDVPVLSGR